MPEFINDSEILDAQARLIIAGLERVCKSASLADFNICLQWSGGVYIHITKKGLDEPQFYAQMCPVALIQATEWMVLHR